MNPPATDPWVITQREKIKYQEQFKSLQPQNGFITGVQAKGFFLQSQLPPIVLGQIWALADTDSDGKMNINEFSIACKLINLKLRGLEIPKVLPPTILASLSSAAGTPSITPPTNISPINAANVMAVGSVPAKPNGQTNMAPSVDIAGQVIASPAIATASIPPVAIIPGQQPVIASVVPPVGGIPLVQAPPMVPIAPIPPIVPIASGMTMPPVMQMGQPAVPAAASAVPMPVGSTVSSVVAAGKITSPPGAKPIILPPPPTPPQSNPPSRHMSISEKPPSVDSPQLEWAISVQTKLKYTQVFNSADRTRSGFLTGVQARGILVHSKLPHAVLAQIWTLADMDCDGRLSCEEFILAMYLCDKAINGEKIPTTLPPELIPPGFRKSSSRHSSIAGSRHGSISTSRHASISSQGAMDGDPAAGLPQTSFEDKRKENFDKGQAELDRRRKLLMDQQRKEQEERERKEREEIEKREKARLEAEKKQQEELERQLQQQREIELEKEEQRKRALEAKEAARKELEKQRQQEWEQARIAEMNSQKQREQEKVLKLKAHNQTLNVELSTLNEKIKDLSQRICDTRAGVTNVKSVIDGMRSTRDTSMKEMTELKARIKEQNAKLLQLTQEKAKWEAKTKSGQFADGANQEQMNAAFASKQLIIKQLKDKNENIRKEIESKKDDDKSNEEQMTEIKDELIDLIQKCEKLYTDYDTQRTLVLELKYNKKNENFTATSAWDTSSSANTWSADTTAVEANDLTAIDTSGPAPEGFVKYRAVYEFSARNADEITFNPGDIILVPLEQNAEPGWLAGEINGHTGWFPETYVEKIEETYPAETAVATTEAEVVSNIQDTYNDNNQRYGDYTTPAPETETLNGDGEYYIAAYPYESNEVGDLNFVAGEMVFVTKKEGDWWTGTIGERTGMFPCNYVQKADYESTESVQLPKQEETQADSYVDDQRENNVNGNAQPYETAQDVIQDASELNYLLQQQQQQEQQEQNETKVTTTATTDDSRTQEELDTEVSQINTQSKSIEHSESFSRPMSRTSSMTPGMRGKRSEIAQVIAPYEATSKEQLSLVRGQLIMIRKKTDSGWWEGELQAKGRRRQIGWFPATYVKVLQGGRNSGRNTPVSGSRVEMTETILDKVIALYPYKAQNDDELSFEKDDIISVLGRDEPDWWRGELNGLTGVFPSNYVGPFVTSGNV